MLKIDCAPVTWPIGMGKRFRGVFDLLARPPAALHARARSASSEDTELIEGLDNPRLDRALPGRDAGAAPRRRPDPQRQHAVRRSTTSSPAGRRRCSSARAINNFGVQEILQALIDWAPPPQPRDGGSAHGAARRGAVHRLRVQDPGQHGPAAPRPHRVLPRLLGPLHARDEGAPPAHRPRDEARQRADLHGQRARRQRGRGRRRHHRHPQPRPAADRRHADRRRGARLQGHPVLRAGALPRRAPARPVQGQAAAEGPAGTGRGGRDPGVRVDGDGNTLLLGAVGQLQFEIVAQRLATEYKVDAIYDTANIATARWLTLSRRDGPARTSSASRRRRSRPTSTATRCSSPPTSTTCR